MSSHMSPEKSCARTRSYHWRVALLPHPHQGLARNGQNPGRPFDEWTEAFGSERLTHHVQILEMNGESYRLKRSRENVVSQAPDDPDEE